MISRTEMMPETELTETDSDYEKPVDSREDIGLFTRPTGGSMTTRSFREHPVAPLNRGASESLAPVDEYNTTTTASAGERPHGRSVDTTSYTRDSTRIVSVDRPQPAAVHDHLYARDEEERLT